MPCTGVMCSAPGEEIMGELEKSNQIIIQRAERADSLGMAGGLG